MNNRFRCSSGDTVGVPVGVSVCSCSIVLLGIGYGLLSIGKLSKLCSAVGPLGRGNSRKQQEVVPIVGSEIVEDKV